MAETPADVRRDIELTRERMSSTLDQLERKLNVPQLVRENPWPALGLAVAAGFILSGSRADVRAAAATVAATRGAGSRLGPVLDDLVSQVVSNVSQAFETRVNGWVDEIKGAIGAPQGQAGSQRLAGQGMGQSMQGHQGGQRFADMNYGSDAGAGHLGHEGLVDQAGSAGIGGTHTGGTHTGGYGTGPAHTTPGSFGNAAAGTNPTGPGTSGAPGGGGATGMGRAD